ncbi:MAG: T9SS type A sorting domain-containing protein [Bacteroidales bacterium]|nr:T9SS type A sorting domain-containing protein [Bacteroidales bacterium]
MKNTYFLLIVFIITSKILAQEITFSTHVIDDNFDMPAGIYVSDINNDGNKDVISAAISGTIAWWENKPGDTIIWQKHIVDNDFPDAIYCSAADIDDDSLTDILGAAYDGDEIAWWHNDGGNPIQWTKQTIESNFIDAHEIMAYDIDQDNDMDIIGVSAGLNTIAWFENDGSYPVQWTKHIVDNNFAGVRSVDAGDLDGDGDIDLAGAALTDNEIAWWRNDGGSPIEWTKFTINSNFIYSHKVHIADIDLDDDLDILGTAYSSGVIWWRNDGRDPIVWEEKNITSLYSAVIAYAVDINQDGDFDVISSYQGAGKIILLNNEGNNTLNWNLQYIDNNLAGAWPLYYSDLDNDGDIDIVCGGRNENEIRWYENDLVTLSSVIHVPGDQPTIQAGIDVAQNKDTVLVAPGTYFENINFKGKNIVVASYFVLDNDNDFIDSTIIDGSEAQNTDTASCVRFVSGEDSTTVLQGFTITQGTGTHWIDPQFPDYTWHSGGGVFIFQSSPTIKNNYIVGNHVDDAMGVSGASGGGICMYGGNSYIINNIIKNNTALYGAGVVIDYAGCVFKNNIVAQNSGGQNFGGGGFWTIGNGTQAVIIENNTIVDNESELKGGAMYLWSTQLTAHNNIIWGNTQNSGGSVYLYSGANAEISYSDIEGGYTGEGNIDLLPQFADTNFILVSTSPCIDAGNPNVQFNDPEDLENPGQALWPSHGRLRNDMGAYGGPLRNISVFLPEITLQPENDTVCEGSFTSLQIDATNATSFQWQVDIGEGFVNITDDEIYSGSSSIMLVISNLSLDMASFNYCCIVSNEYGSIISNIVTINVLPSPSDFSITGEDYVMVNETKVYSVPETNGINYTWHVENGTIIEQISNQSISVSWENYSSGYIWVIAENEFGCFSDTVKKEISITTSIEGKIHKECKYTVFPNPVDDNLNVKPYNYARLELYDILGNAVLTTEKSRINVSVLNPGIYFLKIIDKNENTLEFKRIIIK